MRAKKSPNPHPARLGSSNTGKYMQNCTQTDRVGQGFWLHFQAVGDGLDMLESSLPTPNYYHRTNEATYTVAWLIDGYFGTRKGVIYLNDMIARLSLGMKIANRLPYAPRRSEGRAYELKEFQNLPSLPTRTKKEPNALKYDDAVFWALKLEAIARIKSAGWLHYEGFEAWAFDVFIVGRHVKDRSTLRAKCRSIWKWYDERDWKTDERSFTMSRADAAAKATAARQERAKAKIQGAINILRLYGKKITAKAVAEEAGVNLKTAQKYVKQLKEEGAI